MGIKYLWDTNAVTYFLQSRFPVHGQELIRDIINTYTPSISVITEMELKCWKTILEEDAILLKSFIEDCRIFELDREIKSQAVKVRRAYNLRLPDAIIAATAICMDLTLISNDKKGFNNIASLKLFNPALLV